MKPSLSSAARLVALGVLLLAWPAFQSEAAEEIRIEKVFGPETLTGPYKHPASIAELKNGDLYLAYYGGAGEHAVETSVFGSRRVKGSSAWIKPEEIVYHETGADPELTGPDTTSLFLRFNPSTKEWTESNRVGSRLGNLQPAAVQLSDKHLLAFCRRGGDYEPGNDGNVVRTESIDSGKTWSAGTETDFPNPNAAVELIRLRNGHLLFVYNNSANDRTPLTAAISTDNGKTFPHRRNIAEGAGDFAYPSALEAMDGSIHIAYTSDERTVIRHAILREEAILGRRAD